MFETNDRGRIPDSPFFPPQEGSHRWAYVAQTSSSEWFMVAYEVVKDGEKHSQQLLMPSAKYVLGLASREGDDEAIKEIQLVSPPWLNESGRWLMEPLKKIHLAGRQFCYELGDGRFYPSVFSNESSKIMWQMKGAEHG